MSHLKSIWCFVLAAIAGVLVATSPAFGADYVVHISVDGLNASCLEDLIAADPGEYDSFKRLIDEGASTFNARTDYTYTNTLPNHTSMTTALPVSQPAGQPNTDYHGYTSNSDPSSSDTLHNSGNPNRSYIASAFDVAHDHGLSTALYASKSKFVIYEQSYNSSNGASDITGPDNGKDKIDSYVNDSSGLHADFLADMATSRFNYSWVHHRNPDDAGHGSGWCSSAWDDSIKDIDDYIGDILALIEGDGVLDGNTIIIVTTDHGGTGTGHSSASDPLNYTIPVFVWGGDVAVGTDLYALNAGVRLDPGTSRPDYNAALQPLRNGGTGNLALSALGLPAVPGSTINDSQDLIVSASSGFDEDFDSGFTTGATIGTHAAWFDDGDGPVVTASAGTAGSIGLAPADHIFTWSAHPFDWNDASLVSVTLSMDFQTSSTGLFDDDRVGWMITDDDVGSSNIFAVQLDPGPSGLNIEGYWDGSSADKRPSIVDLPALSNSTWYRLTSVITKLSPTSARIDVTFTELDGSGDPVGAQVTGSIADTSALGADAPNSKYFTPSIVWPAYKNYANPPGGGTDGGADNAHFALSTLNQHTLSVATTGDGSVAIDPDQALYDFGDEVTLTANPGSGETFIVWSGDLTGTDNPATVTITDDLSITASFSGSAAGEVIISGIQSYNNSSIVEFIELFNTTSQTISLEGLEIISRVDSNADGTLDLDWELAEESPDLTGAVIAPHSFYLIGESGVAGGADLTVNMDLATGEGGASERAIGIQLIIDGVHQDHLLYGRDDGSSPSGDVPAGDLDPFGSYPRAEVTRNTLGGSSFAEGVLQRLSVSDLYAGHAVPGYYTDEASLGDGKPVGVWSSPHDRNDGSYTPRSATSDPVPPPCTTDIECDDSNVCTDNVCNLGSCEVSNNTDYCNDNVSCTSGDVCSGGVCAGADNCAGDSACDSGLDMCVADPPAQARAAYSNAQDSSTSDGANTDTFIAAGDLEADTDYLVIYNAGYGGAGSNNEVGARITYGSTVWGRSVDEGSGSGEPEAVRIHQLSGFAVIPGTGTDELRIKHQRHNGTSYIKGKSIIAVPLDQLVEGSDYFVSQHNSDSIEGSDGSGSPSTIRSVTFDLPDAGDYLVLASMEATMTNGANNGGSLMRLQINGSTQKMEWEKEWETNNQSQNFAYARIHNLSAGESTFELQGGVSQGSRTASFRRSRIILFRAASYDQMTSTTTDAQSSTSASFETSDSNGQYGWDEWLTNTYTPNQTEDVVVIGNGFAWQGQNYRSTAARLENTTDGTVLSEFTADDAKDTNVDRVTHLVTGFENIDATKTYEFQMSNENNTNSASQRQYGDLIVWSLSLAAACGDGAVDAGEDCDDGGNANGDGCDESCNYETGACNDGLFCTSGEIWSSGVCGGGLAVTGDDSVSCTDDSCDEVNDVIVNTVNHGLCDNGAFCDGSETCDATLDCQAGTAPTVSDGVGCTVDSCDEVNDVIVNTVNHGLCDNGAFCDGSETCDATLDCQAGTAPTVSDGVGCTVDSCDEVNDVIVNVTNDAYCDNGAFCDGSETCDAALDCQAGTAPTADDSIGCTDDSCDEVNDVIVNAVNQ